MHNVCSGLSRLTQLSLIPALHCASSALCKQGVIYVLWSNGAIETLHRNWLLKWPNLSQKYKQNVEILIGNYIGCTCKILVPSVNKNWLSQVANMVGRSSRDDIIFGQYIILLRVTMMSWGKKARLWKKQLLGIAHLQVPCKPCAVHSYKMICRYNECSRVSS